MGPVIDAHECIVRMKTGNKLRPEDVGRKTSHLAITYPRHLRQSKVNPSDGAWMWEKRSDGPMPGEQISVLDYSVMSRWLKVFEAYRIDRPSFGLLALVMTLEFLRPDRVLCAACDSFFTASDPPGSPQERALLSTLPIEELKAANADH
jgi:hypothetical protein